MTLRAMSVMGPRAVAAAIFLVFAGVGFGFAADKPDPLAVSTRTLLTLIRSPQVHAELKLDKAQIATALAAVDEIDQPFWRLRELPTQQARPKLEEMRSRFQQKLETALRREQRRRLDQLLLQAKGITALLDDSLAEKLGLSSGQQERLTACVTAGETAAAGRPGAAEAEQKAMAILTNTQRRNLEQLVGEKFDFSSVRRVAVKAPEIAGITDWINSQPRKLTDFRGKVVVLHFWTFGCINCIHNLPVYNSWHDELPRDRVVILGIHTPETTGERQFAELRNAVEQRKIKFPVAMDLQAETWKAWGNSIWPAIYLIDRHGDVRYWWTGELKWNGAQGDKLMRERIEQLLAEQD